MICDGLVKPLRSFGSIRIRKSGASINVLVIGSTVMAGRSEKWSACTTSAGRDFPCSPCSATVTRSPRLTPSSRSYLSRQTKRRDRDRPDLQRLELSGTAGRTPEQSQAPGCQAPISAQAVALQPSACHDAAAHAALRFRLLSCVTCSGLTSIGQGQSTHKQAPDARVILS